MIPHADNCIVKVTNYITTIGCWKDSEGCYVIGIETLNKMMDDQQKVIFTGGIPATIKNFNSEAKSFGFRRQITEGDFR